jgi:aspartyl-tRNA(Asn)/glutamyl-tRNA(Gln) amidotransferase subunit A
MTRTVADAALMLDVLTLPDSRDWFALPYDPWEYQVGLDLGIRRLRVAYSPNLGYVDVDPEVAAAVKQAAAVLSELGAAVEQVDPGFECPLECFNTHWYAGAAHLMERFSDQQRELMDPGFVQIATEGAEITLSQYMAAVDDRVALGQCMNAFHETYDLLVTPSLPCPAFRAGDPVADLKSQDRWPDWTPFTYPFNLTGQPACSVPCGFTKSGLPIGMQIVGPQFSDPLVLRVASAFEAVRPFTMPDKPNPG